MNLRIVVAGIALVTFAAAASVQAAQAQPQGQAQAKPEQKPDQKPEPKADDKAGAAFAGKWNGSVQSPNGAVDVTIDVKIDGKKVAGTIASQMGENKIEGEIADGKLTFWFTMDMGGQQASITFTGAAQKDGSLAGSISLAGQGEMTWTAVRVK